MVIPGWFHQFHHSLIPTSWILLLLRLLFNTKWRTRCALTDRVVIVYLERARLPGARTWMHLGVECCGELESSAVGALSTYLSTGFQNRMRIRDRNPVIMHVDGWHTVIYVTCIGYWVSVYNAYVGLNYSTLCTSTWCRILAKILDPGIITLSVLVPLFFSWTRFDNNVLRCKPIVEEEYLFVIFYLPRWWGSVYAAKHPTYDKCYFQFIRAWWGVQEAYSFSSLPGSGLVDGLHIPCTIPGLHVHANYHVARRPMEVKLVRTHLTRMIRKRDVHWMS
jgi:hypothetical protein